MCKQLHCTLLVFQHEIDTKEKGSVGGPGFSCHLCLEPQGSSALLVQHVKLHVSLLTNLDLYYVT